MKQTSTKKNQSFKLIKHLLACCVVLGLFTFGVNAQNLALSATFSHNGGGAGIYGPSNYNDQVNSPGTFGWASGTGSTVWIQADWGSTTVSIDTIRVFPDQVGTRNLSGGDVQSWNGSSWTTVHTFSVTPSLEYDIVLPNTMTTTKFRITNVTVSGSQANNPSIREIEVYENSSYGSNNIGIESYTPTFPCAGANDIKVTVRNYGQNIVDSFMVNWTINGVAQTPYNYTGTALDTNKGAGINRVTLTLGQHSFVNNDVDTIVIWTSAPNGGADTVNNNDTADIIKKPSLNGTFTVGGVGANYASLTAAFNDLYQTGVCGPVILDVDSAAGPYNEQLTLGSIQGTNSTNTVTVKGNGARVWYGATTNSDKHVIRFDGASYVIIDNLELEVTSTSYAWTVHFLNSSNNTVKNCKIKQTQTSSTNTNFIGVCFNGNESWYYYTFSGQNNTLENNDISGGYFNILMYGTYGGSGDGNKIIGNTVRDFYVYGMYVYGQKNLLISGNDVHRLNRTSLNTFYGIYLYNGNVGLVCEKNRIHNPRPTSSSSSFTAYGIASYYEYYSNHNNIIKNNLIYDFENNSTNYGIYNYYSYPYTALNNTIVFDDETVSGGNHYGMSFRTGYGTQDFIYNNNIVVKPGTGGTKYGLYEGGSNGTTGLNVDHNNVSVTGAGAGTAYWGAFGGSGVNTVADWNDKAGSSNQNNTEVDPQFRDPANLNYEPKDARLNGAGFNTSDVTDDFNGDSRGSATMDIGAFNMNCDFGITAFTLPNATECELYTPDIQVTVKNYSSKEYTNIPVGLFINDANLVTDYADITLAASGSGSYTYQNSYTFVDAGSYVLKTFPLNDAVLPNDTQSFNLTILPAPRGSRLNQGTGNKGIFRGGAINSYDVTTAGDEVVYDISIPNGGGTFTDANYSTAWTIPMYVETATGVQLPSSMYSVTPPTSTTDAIMKFTPDANYTDSLLKMVIPVKNLVNGCDSTIERYIFVAPIPFVNFKAPNVCDGDGIGFENLSEISTGTLEYEWDFGLTPPATTTNTSPVFKYPTYGIYNVKLTATSNWGYKHDTTIQVTVFESPNVKFRAINACEGNAVQFQNNTSVSAGTLTYTWDFGDGSPADMTENPNHTYANAGEYGVTLTAEVSGCKRALKKSAFQFPQPVADFDISGGDCNEQEVEFTNKSTLEFGRLGNLWDFGDNSYTTTSDAKHTYTGAGEQSITLKITSEFGCTDQITKKVTLKESPIASFDNTQTCDIDPVDFTNTSFEPTGANVDYTWTFGDPTSADNTSSLTNPSHKYSLPGARKVTLVAEADNGCSHQVTKDIVIGVQPQADFSAEAGCTDEPIKFNNETTISRGDIEVVYDWSFGSNDVSPEHAFATAGTQSVTLTATATEGGCKDEITKDVVVGETPSCEFTTSTTGHKDITFTPEADAAGLTYTWIFGDGGSSTDMNPTYTYLFDKAYEVTLRVSSAEGCECEKTQFMKTTSVGDVNFAERVSIYPNPSTGVFTIEIDGTLTEDVSIEVYNSLGAVVAVVDVNQSVDGKYIVNLGDVAAGVYTVKFTSSSSVYTQKVTVTK